MKSLSMQQLLSKHRLPVTTLLAVLILLGLTPSAVYAGYSTRTTVTCKPSPADQSGTVTCTATVADLDGGDLPTGKVTWTESGPLVTFKSTSCWLIDDAGIAKCSVTVICDGFGEATFTAEYSGVYECNGCSGQNLNGSKGTFKLQIAQLA